jgi:hypothetical protein
MNDQRPTTNDQRPTEAARAVRSTLVVGASCVTCSDEAIEVNVLRMDTTTDMALVMLEETTIEIDVSLIDTIIPGDRLLIHGGVAIAKL